MTNLVPARLPDLLRPRVLDSFDYELPVYVHPMHILLRDGTNELFIDGEKPIRKKEIHPKTVLGRVGIMRVMLSDGPSSIVPAIVADVRCINNSRKFSIATPAERPDDDEEASWWLEDREYERPIVAVVCNSPDRPSEYFVVGDRRLEHAALHLAELTDALFDAEQKRARRHHGVRSGKR